MPSLSEKLKSLGVKIGATDLPMPEPAGRYEIDKVVEGSYRPTSAGETFVASQPFGAEYRHGQAAIRPEASFEVLAAWAREPRFLDLPLEAYAFLDTETSGLAGGTGTYAFLVGVGRFRTAEFQLEQFFMRDPAEEAGMLNALAEFLAPCKALVTFNGKAFDAPLLMARYTLHSLPNPMDGFAHLDLLPLARRLWRDRLPSRALKYLEENVLYAPRNSEEVPGYEIPYLYFDYLRSRDGRPLKGVFYHNAMDVVAMAALLSHVTAILADPFGEKVEHGLDVVALAKLFEDLGRWDTAARLFERGLEMELPEADFWLAIQRLSHLQKRRGDLETAIGLWERAASQGHVYAHVELAKYHEHQRRDYAEALKWTHSAVELVSTRDMPRYMVNHWMEELQHRQERLAGKIRTLSGIG
ncbi:MAG: ribonuclease H-like domain-containing protein [Anaerolineales bacterium]